LGTDAVALASSWSSLDAWVGRVGEAFERADSGGLGVGDRPIGPPAPARVVAVSEGALGPVAAGPTWVDPLSDDEAAAAAIRLAARLRPVADRITGDERSRLRARLWPLVQRLRTRWPAAAFTVPAASPSKACASPPVRSPDGLEDALDILQLGGPGRAPHTAGVVEGFADGFLGGDLAASYDNLGAEVARTAGHVTSGVLVFGDVRDGIYEGSRGNWVGAAFAAAGLIPIAGDGMKGAKAIDEVVDARRLVIDLAEEGARGGHTLDLHVGQATSDLRHRLVVESDLRFSSSFVNRTEAEAAVAEALSAKMGYVERITVQGRPKTVFRYDVGRPVGEVVPAVGPPASTSVIEVVLRADAESPSGFRVQSAYPVRGLR
jgi:hypothetical protein